MYKYQNFMTMKKELTKLALVLFFCITASAFSNAQTSIGDNIVVKGGADKSCPAVSVPFFEGFESGFTHNTKVENCWTQESLAGTEFWTANQTHVDNNRTPRTGNFNAFLKFSNTDWLFYKVNLNQGVIYDFTVWAIQNHVSGASLTLAWGTEANSAAMTNIVVDAQAITNVNYQKVTGLFAVPDDGIYYIGIKGTLNSNPWYLSIDDISLGFGPSCVKPSNIQASNVVSNSVKISWLPSTLNPSATSYHVYCSTINTAPEDGISSSEYQTAPNSTFNLVGLMPETQYYVWVRSDCGAGEHSDWAGGISFTTLCAPITALPYTENFDTYSTGSSAFPLCWLRPVTFSGYPYIVNDAYASSPRSLKFCSSTTQPTYAVTQAFAADVHNLRVSFQLKAENTTKSGTIELGVMSDPADISTFESIATIQPSNTLFNNYKFDLYPASLSGENRHIAFKHTSNSNIYYFWLDNFKVELSPDCVEPANFEANNVTANSVYLSWTPLLTAPANGYDVYLSQENVAPSATATTYNTTEDFMSFNDIEPNTTYYAWVRSHCGASDYSVWAGPISFTTEQVPAILPYIDDFATNKYSFVNGTQANQWFYGSVTGNPADAIYISNNWGTGNVYNYNSASVVHAYRDLAIPDDASLVSVSFDWKCVGEGSSTKYDYFRVWIVPVTFTPTAGTQIVTADGGIQIGYSFNLQSTWQNYKNPVLNLSSFAGQTVRLVFEWRNDPSGGANPPAAIDNVKVINQSCVVPLSITFSDIDSISATVTWNNSVSNPGSYHVYYSTSNIEPADEITSGYETTNTNSIELSNLESNTKYYVWVRSVCGTNDYSVWTIPVSFTTKQTPAELPYVDDFSTNQYSFVNGTETNKWFYGSATGNPANAIYISNDGGASNSYSFSFTSIVHAYRDIKIPNDASLMSFKFDWKCVGESTHDFFRVWMVPVAYTPSAGNTISSGGGRIQIGGNFNQQSTWQTYQDYLLDLSSFAGQTMRLVFEWRNDNSVGYNSPVAIDNVSLLIPDCTMPTNLEFSDVELTSANISWQNSISSPGSYHVYRSTSNIAPDENTTGFETTNTNSITLSGLGANTVYYVWVRSACGTNNYSVWTEPISFTTKQIPANIPYVDNFDTNQFTFVNGTQINQWVYGSATGNPENAIYISDNGGANNSYTMNTYCVVHAFRDIAVSSDIDFVNFSFNWKCIGEGSFDYFRVWIVPIDYMPTAGTQITNEDGGIKIGGNFSAKSTWQTYQDYVLDLTSFAGQTIRLVFEWKNDDNGGSNPPAAIDNISLVKQTCVMPSDLEVTNVGQTSATITWNNSISSPDSYNVYYAKTNAVLIDTVTVFETTNTNSITLSGLESNLVTYYVWVRADCGANGNSIWIGPVEFTTLCTPVHALPYTENFDSYGTGTTAFPDCWERPVTYGGYPAIVGDEYLSPSRSLKFQASTSAPTYAVSPAFEEDIHKLRVSFQLKAENTTHSGTIDVGVMSDPLNINTFELVATILPTNTEYNYYYYDLSATVLSGENRYIAFRHNFTSSSGYDWYYWLDDFVVNLSPNCIEPQDIEATNITTNSANISWTASSSSPDDYHVYYAKTNVVSIDTVTLFETTNTNSITLTELDPNTEYYVWVRSDCGLDGYSVWVGPVEFTTVYVSNEADILTYSIPNQVGETDINETEKAITVTMPYNTDVTNLVATFTLSSGAAAQVDGVDQVSGSTGNNFTNPVLYTVTAEDATTTKNWTVTVTVLPANTETDILTYSFAEQHSPAVIDDVNHTVNIEVDEGTNVTNLVATFTLSDGASAKIGAVDQQTGVTPNNFTEPVIYTVTAEDGTTTQPWTVTVSVYVGIEDVESSAFTIYPNPNNGKFTLDFTNINGKVNYQIFDTKGSIILSDNFVASGNTIKEVSLNLVPGVYFVKLVTETQSLVEKLVVE